MEGFTGSELVVANAYALRTWEVDKQGRLESYAIDYTWRPSENVSYCNITQETMCDAASDCHCGFWAYHTRSGDAHSKYAVTKSTNNWHGLWSHALHLTGVIQVSGRVVVGTLGVRCERAKVVAVCVPPPGVDPEAVARLGDGWSEQLRVSYAVGLTSAAVTLAALVGYALSGSRSGLMPSVVIAAFALLVIAGCNAVSLRNAIQVLQSGPEHGLSCALSGNDDKMRCDCYDGPTRIRRAARAWRARTLLTSGWDVRDRITELYPDVQIFDTVEEMDAAYAESLGSLSQSPDRLLAPDDPRLWGSLAQGS